MVLTEMKRHRYRLAMYAHTENSTFHLPFHGQQSISSPLQSLYLLYYKNHQVYACHKDFRCDWWFHTSAGILRYSLSMEEFYFCLHHSKLTSSYFHSVKHSHWVVFIWLFCFCVEDGRSKNQHAMLEIWETVVSAPKLKLLGFLWTKVPHNKFAY